MSADGFPVPEIEFVVTFEGGSQRTGQLDRNGRALLKDPPNEAFRVEYKSHDDVRARSLAARLHDAILRQDIELIRGVLGQSSRLLQVIKSAYETYFNALGGNGFVADIRAAVADFPDDQHLIDHLLVASGIDNPTGATVIARREPDALPGDGVIV